MYSFLCNVYRYHGLSLFDKAHYYYSGPLPWTDLNSEGNSIYAFVSFSGDAFFSNGNYVESAPSDWFFVRDVASVSSTPYTIERHSNGYGRTTVAYC